MRGIITTTFASNTEAAAAIESLLKLGIDRQNIYSIGLDAQGKRDQLPLGIDSNASPKAQHAGRDALAGAAIGAAVGAGIGLAGGVLAAPLTTAVGAYVGSLAGAMSGLDQGDEAANDVSADAPVTPQFRMVVETLLPAERQRVTEVLAACGGRDIALHEDQDIATFRAVG